MRVVVRGERRKTKYRGSPHHRVYVDTRRNLLASPFSAVRQNFYLRRVRISHSHQTHHTFLSLAEGRRCCTPAAYLPAELRQAAPVYHTHPEEARVSCFPKEKADLWNHGPRSAGDPAGGGVHHRRERVLQQPRCGCDLFRPIVYFRHFRLRAPH